METKVLQTVTDELSIHNETPLFAGLVIAGYKAGIYNFYFKGKLLCYR